MAFLQYEPTASLFHYCGSSGFSGITKSGSIWLTDLQCANDPKELQLAKVIETLMLELISASETDAELRATYEDLVPHLKRLRAKFGLNSFSLSLKGDQLPMWQEYTDRGSGFCIAFRATAFNHMPLRIQKVQYVSQYHLGSLHSRVESIVRPLVGHLTDQIAQIHTVSELLSLVSSVKDEPWQHEEEVRLVFSSMVRPEDFEPGMIMPISVLPDGTSVFPENPLLRERDGEQVPYYIKPFGRFNESKWNASGAIAQVIIGPNNTSSTNEMRDYLLGLGYKNFEVVHSRCAFRL